MAFLSAAEIHVSFLMCKPSSRRQRGVFSRAKAQPCFQSIEGVLVFWRAVSVQALDNVLFDGVQWLTRPHLSPRPLLLSSPHALPCKAKHTDIHPLTHTHAHSQTHTPALSASFLWRILAVVYVIELVITLQLEHHQAQRERVLPLS